MTVRACPRGPLLSEAWGLSEQVECTWLQEEAYRGTCPGPKAGSLYGALLGIRAGGAETVGVAQQASGYQGGNLGLLTP